jgi:hypothetical protein
LADAGPNAGAFVRGQDQKRADDIKAMNQFLYDQYASITLWDGMSVFALRPGVHYQPIEHRMPFLVVRNVAMNNVSMTK